MRTRYRQIAETVIKMTHDLFTDGRSKLNAPDYSEWLNHRLQMRTALLTAIQQPETDYQQALKEALRELTLTLAIAGKHSDMPVGRVLALMEEAHALLGEEYLVGFLVTDDYCANAEEAEEFGISEGKPVLEVDGRVQILHGKRY